MDKKTDIDFERVIAQGRRVLEIEIEALKSSLNEIGDDFAQGVKLLYDCVSRGQKIIVVGVGKSGNIGKKIVATLNSTGSTAVALSSQNAMHGDLGIVSDGDVIIALSNSGETMELVNLLSYIKKFQAHIIAITKSKESTLSQLADVTLLTPIQREACPLNLAPTSSSTAALAMGDAVAMALLDSRGFTDSDFARFHPGGSLGRSLHITVDEVMRKGDRFPTVSPSDSIGEVIEVMGSSRSGAAVVVNENQNLLGIFTHGDFVRSVQKNVQIIKMEIRELMIKKPITVQKGALAAEALHLLSANKIDDLVVINEQGQAIGLIDSQDLSYLKIV